MRIQAGLRFIEFMYIAIAIGMVLTGVLFLIKAAGMKPEEDLAESINPATRKLLELKYRQKKSLRKMGLLTILLGLALIVVTVVYPVD